MKRFLKEMIGSIQAQTYGNWQLCLADGSLSGDDVGTAENGHQEKCDCD